MIRELIQHETLNPCPFCGGEATVFQIPENDREERRLHPKWDWNYPGRIIVGCWTEMCMGNINNMAMVFTTKESATETWNRRNENARRAGEEQAER